MPDAEAIAQRAIEIAARGADELVTFAGAGTSRDLLHEAMKVLHAGGADDDGSPPRREAWERHAADELLMATASILEPDDGVRDPYSVLEHEGEAALRRGDLMEAEAAGIALVDRAEVVGADDPNHGHLVHNGHLLLGMVGLRRGDIDAAARELRAAGTSSGSPVLDSFGPDLQLAFELLALHRDEDVVAYLRGVTTFWTSWRRELER